MRGGPDDHVLVHGQETDAGHAPDPETAGAIGQMQKCYHDSINPWPGRGVAG